MVETKVGIFSTYLYEYMYTKKFGTIVDQKSTETSWSNAQH